MGAIKLGRSIITMTLLYYIIYNTYFGWNDVPINEKEAICDRVAKIFFYIGFIIYLSPIFSLYEYAVMKKESKKKTD